MPFAVEFIPDADSLFRRAHRRQFYTSDEPTPGAFKREGSGGMSVNWAKYATAEETRRQAAQPPENYGVLITTAGQVRAIDDLRVDHTPNDANRAHSDIIGVEDAEIRLKLLRAFTVELRPLRPGE